MQTRTVLIAAGVLGGTGVVLGAFGAHALKAYLLERGYADVWETGVRYQLIHAVALLGFAGWMRGAGERSLRRAAWTVRLWTAGTVLFSGSLYGLAVGGPRWLGPVTPLGGLALLAGWVAVVIAAAA